MSVRGRDRGERDHHIAAGTVFREVLDDPREGGGDDADEWEVLSSLAGRLTGLVFGVGFGSAMIVSGLILPAEQFTSPSFGPFAGFSSLLGVLCAVGIARWTIGELRLAARLRHLRRGHRPEEVDP